jgi:hypothetical protein
MDPRFRGDDACFVELAAESLMCGNESRTLVFLCSALTMPKKFSVFRLPKWIPAFAGMMALRGICRPAFRGDDEIQNRHDDALPIVVPAKAGTHFDLSKINGFPLSRE